MAEGFARQLLPATWQVASAGLEAQGVNPRAIRVMREVGVDITAQRSTRLDPSALAQATMIVTLCGDARDHCPVTPAMVTREHWPLPDPAQATGTPEQQLAVFRAVRDEIRQRVVALAQQLAD
ncbi:arsenate reductase [Levilactobacillus namurensis DSM 19117]|uniref:Arsenate reductase n=2 Tax=Levilactobacillus namurensis TaxID=380393 RepID=A0A0R1K0A1_9LACO|nr:arsenate reductase [Levilactobacillus namurensis DSM 19117]